MAWLIPFETVSVSGKALIIFWKLFYRNNTKYFYYTCNNFFDKKYTHLNFVETLRGGLVQNIKKKMFIFGIFAIWGDRFQGKILKS